MRCALLTGLHAPCAVHGARPGRPGVVDEAGEMGRPRHWSGVDVVKTTFFELVSTHVAHFCGGVLVRECEVQYVGAAARSLGHVAGVVGHGREVRHGGAAGLHGVPTAGTRAEVQGRVSVRVLGLIRRGGVRRPHLYQSRTGHHHAALCGGRHHHRGPEAARVLGRLSLVDRQLLLRVEDGEAGDPLGPVDSHLCGDAALLVIVPLSHEGGVALPAGEHRLLLVRGPAAQWRLQLLQEGEERLRLEAGVAVR